MFPDIADIPRLVHIYYLGHSEKIYAKDGTMSLGRLAFSESDSNMIRFSVNFSLELVRQAFYLKDTLSHRLLRHKFALLLRDSGSKNKKETRSVTDHESIQQKIRYTITQGR